MGGAIGSGLAALIALGIILMLILLVCIYVYSSYAWMIIAKKLKYKKAWLAWIPIANFAMLLQMGGFSWAWIFLILIPIFGWIALGVLLIISVWRIFEKRKYPGWLSLAILIPEGLGAIASLIILGFVAWKKR